MAHCVNDVTLKLKNYTTTRDATLPHAATLEFEFKGIKEIAQLPTASSPFENDSYFRELIDDLAFIERSADVDFSLPAEAPDPFDRVWIRVARMLLEGRVTAAPGVEELTGTLGHDIDVSSMEATLTQPGAIVLTQYEFAIETLGQRILIGDVAIYHPNAIVLDGEKLFRDAVEGKADLPIAYVPNDATPFRIYSPSRVDNSSKVDPWGIAGISEHQGFAHIPESVAAVARNPPLTGE